MSQNHAEAIGRMCIAFSSLEGQLKFMVGKLVGIDQIVGQIITAELSFRNILNLLGSLYKHRTNDNDFRKKVDDLLKNISNLEQNRNSLIHSTYGLTKDPETIARFKNTARMKHGLKNNFDIITIEQIDHLVVEIENANSEVINLFLEYAEKNDIIDRVKQTELNSDV